MSKILNMELAKFDEKHRNMLKGLVLFRRIIGVDIRQSSDSWSLEKFVNIFFMCLVCLGLMAQSNFIYLELIHHSPVLSYADSFCIAIQISQCMIKMIYMFSVQQDMHDLLEIVIETRILKDLQLLNIDINCKQIIIQRVKIILLESWQDLNKQFKLFFYSVIVICVWYYSSSIFKNIYNLIYDLENFKPTYCMDAAFPHWFDGKPYAVFYTLQYIIVGSEHYTACLACIAFDGLFMILVSHCATLLRILRSLIELSTDKSIPKAARVQYLTQCIKLYQQIFKFYKSTDELYSKQNLIQFCTSTIILCMIMFQGNVAVESNFLLLLQMIIYFMAASFQIGLYCYNGQKIIQESELLPLAWYNCDWYDESLEFKRDIRLMILRTSRGFYMHMAGFGQMSLMTMLGLLQTSWSYFLLLKNVSSSED